MQDFDAKSLILQSDIEEIAERLVMTMAKMSGKTVLVTGAAGFLGRYFIALFQHFNSNNVSNPISIIALDNHQTSIALKKNDYRKQDSNIEWIFTVFNMAE